MSRSRVITLPGFSKERFLLGLEWRHFDARPKPKELRELAQKHGDFASMYKTIDGSWQAGFVNIDGGVKVARLFALAPLVAAARAAPWRGMFQIGDDLYWYIAVRNQYEIIPDGDLIGSFEDVQVLSAQHSTYGSWREYDGDATLEGLAELAREFGTKRKPIRRYAKSGSEAKGGGASKTVIVTGVSLALLGAAAGGGWWVWHQHELEVARRRAAAEAAAAAARARIKPIKPAWQRTPMPSVVLQLCAQQWAAQPLAVNGWRLARWSCVLHVPMPPAPGPNVPGGMPGPMPGPNMRPGMGPGAHPNVPAAVFHLAPPSLMIEAAYKRDGGVAADAPGLLQAGGNASTSQQTLSVPKARDGAALSSTRAALRSLWTLAQTQSSALHLTVARAAFAAAPLLPGQVPQQAARPVNAVNAHFKMVAAPWSTGINFDAVAGLRVLGVRFDGQAWDVQGRLYSSPTSPVNPSHTAPMTNFNPTIGVR